MHKDLFQIKYERRHLLVSKEEQNVKITVHKM